MKRRILAATFALLASHVSSAAAQGRLATDLVAARGSGDGSGVPVERGFLAFGATLVAGVTQLGPGHLMAGVSISHQAAGLLSDRGYFQPDGKTIGGPWPCFRSLSAVAALDVTGTIAGRVTAGAGVFRDNRSFTTGGLSGSVDATFPGRSRVGLLVSATGAVLPTYRGGSYRMRSLSVGVRFSSR